MSRHRFRLYTNELIDIVMNFEYYVNMSCEAGGDESCYFEIIHGGPHAFHRSDTPGERGKANSTKYFN